MDAGTHSRTMLSVFSSRIMPSYLTMLACESRLTSSTSFMSWAISSSPSPSSRIRLMATISPVARFRARYCTISIVESAGRPGKSTKERERGRGSRQIRTGPFRCSSRRPDHASQPKSVPKARKWQRVHKSVEGTHVDDGRSPFLSNGEQLTMSTPSSLGQTRRARIP